MLEAHRGRTTTGTGTWTDDASQIPGETTFYDLGHGLGSTIIGQWLWPDPDTQDWWEIIDVDTDSITVAGDVSDLAVLGKNYTIAPRPYIAQTLTGQWTSAPSNSGGGN